MSLVHYGESRMICAATYTPDVRMTNAIQSITCPDCLIAVMADVDEHTQRWYDRERSEYVTGPFTDGVSLFMGKSMQLRARGVVKFESGKLYVWTIRRPGHGDPICIRGRETRFIMEEWKCAGASLVSVAEGLLRFEGRYAVGHEAFAFGQELTAAKYREMQDAAAILPTVIPESI